MEEDGGRRYKSSWQKRAASLLSGGFSIKSSGCTLAKTSIFCHVTPFNPRKKKSNVRYHIVVLTWPCIYYTVAVAAWNQQQNKPIISGPADQPAWKSLKCHWDESICWGKYPVEREGRLAGLCTKREIQSHDIELTVNSHFRDLIYLNCRKIQASVWNRLIWETGAYCKFPVLEMIYWEASIFQICCCLMPTNHFFCVYLLAGFIQYSDSHVTLEQ